MARQKGAFHYGDLAEDDLEKIVNQQPTTCNAVTKQMRYQKYRKIDRGTIKRMLDNLQQQKKIDNFKIGKVTIWANKKLTQNIRQNL